MQAKRSWFTVSDDGTVNIPAELLARYGLKSGDEVGVVETESGLFLGTREQIAEQLLDQMGEEMRNRHQPTRRRVGTDVNAAWPRRDTPSTA